jgi:hypothetical protein
MKARELEPEAMPSAKGEQRIANSQKPKTKSQKPKAALATLPLK